MAIYFVEFWYPEHAGEPRWERHVGCDTEQEALDEQQATEYGFRPDYIAYLDGRHGMIAARVVKED